MPHDKGGRGGVKGKGGKDGFKGGKLFKGAIQTLQRGKGSSKGKGIGKGIGKDNQADLDDISMDLDL